MHEHHAPEAPLDVDVERSADAAQAVVRVRGDLDLSTTPTLRHRLDGLVGEGVRELLLDLRQVPFCDVPGLNLLLRVQSSLAADDGRLTVLGPCRPLETMVAALGLEAHLDLVRDPGAGGA